MTPIRQRRRVRTELIVPGRDSKYWQGEGYVSFKTSRRISPKKVEDGMGEALMVFTHIVAKANSLPGVN
jgi:hypothetical protein